MLRTGCSCELHNAAAGDGGDFFLALQKCAEVSQCQTPTLMMGDAGGICLRGHKLFMVVAKLETRLAFGVLHS